MTQLIDKSLQNHNALQNMGAIDRIVRIIVGFAMIGLWFLYPIHSISMWAVLFPLVGIYPFLTGILGWCPIYAMFNAKTCGTSANSTCGTLPAQLKQLINPH